MKKSFLVLHQLIDSKRWNRIKQRLHSIPQEVSESFDKYPYAIVLGAQYGKVRKNASGDVTALFLERIAYEIMGYLEANHYKYLVIHPEDVIDPENRMGLISLKILAKQAGLGWQGRSLLYRYMSKKIINFMQI